MATQKTRRPSLYGLNAPLTGLQQEPLVMARAPMTTDSAELGTIWVDTNANDFYVLTNVAGPVNTWTATTGGATTLTSLTVNPGNATITAGNLTVTAGDFTATAGTSTVGTFVAGNSQVNGTLDVTGVVTLASDLDVGGNVTVSGDFDITSADSLSFTTTINADPAILFQANGGVLETIILQSAQGTAADAINLDAVAGGVTITGALATADAINIVASNAAGGIDVDYGTGGATFTGANGAFIVESGTANISIGADAAQHNVTIGSTTGTSAITLQHGTGALNLGANAIAHAINIGNNTGATAVSIQAGTAGAGAINIGTTANAVPVVVGNITGATSVVINSGTGATALNSTDAISASAGAGLTLDAVGAMELNSSGAAISIGNDADAFAINVGTGAAARTITRGNVTGATAIVDNTGTGGYQLNTTGAGNVDINASNDFLVDAAAAFSIDSVAASNVTVTGAGIDLTLSSAGGSVVLTASEAVATAVTIQASNAAGGVLIDANGLVAVDPDVATVASPTASSTQNFRVIRVIFSGFTTAAAASQDFTIVSSQILTTSACLVQVTNLNASTNGAVMTMDGVTQAAGSLIVHTTNNGAGALGAGDNCLVTVWVLS